MVLYPPSLSSTSEILTAMGTWNLVSDVDSEKYKKVQLCCDENKKTSEIQKSSIPSVEKVVNPLGTVTTVFSSISTEVKRDILDEVVSQLAAEGSIIHENCDESLFRPVVAILCDENIHQTGGKTVESEEFCKPPELIKNKLIVPVIAKEVDAELSKRERNQKSGRNKTQNLKKSNLCSTECNKQTTDILTTETGNIQQHMRSERGHMVELVHENNVNKRNTTNSLNLCDNMNRTETKKNLKSLSSVKEEDTEFKQIPLPVVQMRNKSYISEDKELVKGQLSQIESELHSKDLKPSDTKNNPKKLCSLGDNAQLNQTVSENFSIEINENKIDQIPLTNFIKSTKYLDTSKINSPIGDRGNNSNNIKTLSKNNIKCDKLNKETQLKLEIAKETASANKIHEEKDKIRSSRRVIEKISAKGNESHDDDSSSCCNNIIEKSVTMNITKKEKNSSKQKANNEVSKKYTISAHLDEGKGKLSFVQSNLEICESPRISKPNNSVWQTLSSDDQLKSKLPSIDNYPSLGTVGKTKKTVKVKEIMTEQKGNILSDLSTLSKPIDNSSTGILELASNTKKSAKSKENITANSETNSSHSSKQLKPIEKEQIEVILQDQNNSDGKWSFDGFSSLQPLESLPPLPTLESIDIYPYCSILMEKENKSAAKAKTNLSEQLSLINFDSPLQENPRHDEKVPALSKALSQQNLIFALCGSLHCGNDSTCDEDKSSKEYQVAFNSETGEVTTPDYKLLNDGDDQYLSLEHSSQETNTTNTGTANDKSLSSANSSTSEEILVIEEKKLSKKQKRKRQQTEAKEQKEEITFEDDDELRPLITTIKSDSETVTESNKNTFCALYSLNNRGVQEPIDNIIARASPNTTTDSEGAVPATTSDDNGFILPTNTAAINVPTKLKTKRLEHKINLMAAIDAATSSSTSSAEESNLEIENRKANSDQDLSVLGMSTSEMQTTLTNINVVPPSCTTKKKIKRRKR